MAHLKVLYQNLTYVTEAQIFSGSRIETLTSRMRSRVVMNRVLLSVNNYYICYWWPTLNAVRQANFILDITGPL